MMRDIPKCREPCHDHSFREAIVPTIVYLPFDAVNAPIWTNDYRGRPGSDSFDLPQPAGKTNEDFPLYKIIRAKRTFYPNQIVFPRVEPIQLPQEVQSVGAPEALEPVIRVKERIDLHKINDLGSRLMTNVQRIAVPGAKIKHAFSGERYGKLMYYTDIL